MLGVGLSLRLANTDGRNMISSYAEVIELAC